MVCSCDLYGTSYIILGYKGITYKVTCVCPSVCPPIQINLQIPDNQPHGEKFFLKTYRSQDTPSDLKNPKVHYRIHNRPLLVRVFP